MRATVRNTVKGMAELVEIWPGFDRLWEAVRMAMGCYNDYPGDILIEDFPTSFRPNWSWDNSTCRVLVDLDDDNRIVSTVSVDDDGMGPDGKDETPRPLPPNLAVMSCVFHMYGTCHLAIELTPETYSARLAKPDPGELTGPFASWKHGFAM
jgi:hypothetical protein